MATRGMNVRIFILAASIILLHSILAPLSVYAASSAVLVYDHGFAKGVQWSRNGNLIAINKTSSFTQDDKRVYAWLEAAFYSANFTWKWYDPNGRLYANQTRQYQCAKTPCYAVQSLFINWNQVEALFGEWRLDLLNGNVKLYSDYFYMNSVSTQVDYWNFVVESSTPAAVVGSLTVVIHPNNGTWAYYSMYMPYAMNVTAVEVNSNAPLNVTTSKGLITVNLGQPKSGGYSFTIYFKVDYGLYALTGRNGKAYAFAWHDEPWQRFFDAHPVYETFNVTLPKNATLIDVIGIDQLNLKYYVRGEKTESIGFETTVAREPFGWTLIYYDLTYAQTAPYNNGIINSHTNSRFLLPLLPLTLEGLNMWGAIMSIFLFTASELAAPLFERGGSNLLINRSRLRIIAALTMGIFITSAAYQFMLQHRAIAR